MTIDLHGYHPAATWVRLKPNPTPSRSALDADLIFNAMVERDRVNEAYAPRHHLIRGQRVGLKRYHTAAEGQLDPGRRSRSAAFDANSSGVAIHRGQREGAGTLSTGTTGRHGHVSGCDGEVRRGGQRRRIGVSQVECKKESENGEQTVSLHGRNLPPGGLHPARTVKLRLTQGAAMFCRNSTRAQ